MKRLWSRSSASIIASSILVAWGISSVAGPALGASSGEASVISPTVSKDQRRAALDRFWQKWKNVYLVEGCGGAYVDVAGDGKPTYGDSVPNTLTVSEAHGYGMLALVRMAERDRQAKPLFDEMFAYFRAHPAESGPGLMAWNQTRDCKDAPEGKTTARPC